MLVLFVILVLVAGFHFVYESIILPSLRLKNRLRLFALRDRLRKLKIDEPALDQHAYDFVQESLNWFINHLHVIDVAFIVSSAEAVKNDPVRKEKSEKRRLIIENANTPELIKIKGEIELILKKNALANNGACFLYLTPLALLAAGVGLFAESIKLVICIPQRELSKMPLGDYSPMPS